MVESRKVNGVVGRTSSQISTVLCSAILLLGGCGSGTTLESVRSHPGNSKENGPPKRDAVNPLRHEAEHGKTYASGSGCEIFPEKLAPTCSVEVMDIQLEQPVARHHCWVDLPLNHGVGCEQTGLVQLHRIRYYYSNSVCEGELLSVQYFVSDLDDEAAGTCTPEQKLSIRATFEWTELRIVHKPVWGKPPEIWFYLGRPTSKGYLWGEADVYKCHGKKYWHDRHIKKPAPPPED